MRLKLNALLSIKRDNPYSPYSTGSAAAFGEFVARSNFSGALQHRTDVSAGKIINGSPLEVLNRSRVAYLKAVAK
jgi:hypothetical protein